MGKLTCTICGHPIHDAPDGAREVPPPDGGPEEALLVIHVCNPCHEKMQREAKRAGLWKGARHDLRARRGH